jgi:hypothetical protein
MDTGPCDGSRPESVFADRTATSFACSVRASVQPLHSGIDLHQVKLHLSHQGSELRPLKRDRCPFGIMFIIGIGVPRGRYHSVEVVRQARQASECLFTVRLESATRSIHVLNPDATHKKRPMPGLPASPTGCRRPSAAPGTGRRRRLPARAPRHRSRCPSTAARGRPRG